jgi:hypothetical protein
VCQNDECGLEGVLGVLQVAQNPFTHVEDQRPVAFDERRLIAGGYEATEQLAISRALTGSHVADVLYDLV